MTIKNKTALTHDGKVIKTMIASVAKRSASLKADIDTAARCVILHAVKHGDATLADSLIKAMGEGWRLNALRAWFGEFGPFNWVPRDAATKKEAHFAINKAKRTEMLKALEASEDGFVTKVAGYKTYWDYKPEPEFEGFDFQKELKKLIARAEKLERDDSKKDKCDFTGLEKAKGIALGVTAAAVH